MRGRVLIIVGCSSTPSGSGPTDPCERVPVRTCIDTYPDGAMTCDEVYSESSADQLVALCDDVGEDLTRGSCPVEQCCYFENGLFREPSLHCVSDDIDPSYRAYCENNDGIYCPH